jgi:NADH:ubiquinone oxidoreductase subunit H
LSTAQRRSGPNIQGFWGILQAFADGLKLLLKEIIIPVKANQTIYLLSAI